MKIKKLEQFYKDNNIPVQFEDGMPILNGISCLCDYEKRGKREGRCGYICHSGTPCKLYKPRTERINRLRGINPQEVDWDKDYVYERPKTPLELKIEELEARIIELESERELQK